MAGLHRPFGILPEARRPAGVDRRWAARPVQLCAVRGLKRREYTSSVVARVVLAGDGRLLPDLRMHTGFLSRKMAAQRAVCRTWRTAWSIVQGHRARISRRRSSPTSSSTSSSPRHAGDIFKPDRMIQLIHRTLKPVGMYISFPVRKHLVDPHGVRA